MRRKYKRDLIAVAGVVVILFAIVFLNFQLQRGDLAERMDAWRRKAEAERTGLGLELLSWDLVRSTKGGYLQEPAFNEALLGKHGQKVDIVGFMVPLNTFRNMEEFMLLPLPIECYFCQTPPKRDQLLIKMAKGSVAKYVWQEPVLINGRLQLNHGRDAKFFYQLEEANLGPGEPDKTESQLTPRQLSEEHMAPTHTQQGSLEQGYEPATSPTLPAPGTQ